MKYFTPGPTQISQQTKKYIKDALLNDIGSISHRSLKFQNIVSELNTSLRSLFAIPDDFIISFVSSATEAMERIIQNTSESNTFHFVNGAFSRRFYDFSKLLGREARICEVAEGEGFQKLLPANQSELIAITHNETSTGVIIPGQLIDNLRSSHPEAIIAIDVVSSAPFIDFNIANVDCFFFSVQKGFGLPAGLGVLIFSPKALEKAANIRTRGGNIGTYHSFISLASEAAKFQTPETPNVLGIYLLNKICSDYATIGRDKLMSQTRFKMSQLINATKNCAGLFDIAIKDPLLCSPTVLSFKTMIGAENLMNKLNSYGIEVGSGYGSLKKDHIRIANFPVHSDEDFDELANAILKINEFAI